MVKRFAYACLVSWLVVVQRIVYLCKLLETMMDPLPVGLSAVLATPMGCLACTWEHIFPCTSTEEARFNV